MGATFTSKIDYLDKLRMHHIIVTSDILEDLADAEDKSIYNQRFRVTINDSVSWLGGSVSLGNESAYITFSKQRMKELGVVRGDEVTVFLEKDRSEYGLDVPEEFEEVLRQDPDGSARFNSLTKGKRRAIIYMVIQFKTSQKRIEKSLFFIENLKRAPVGEETMRHVIGKDLP